MAWAMPAGQSDWKMFRPMSTPRAPSAMARLSGVTADGVLDQIAAQLPVPPAAGDEFHGA